MNRMVAITTIAGLLVGILVGFLWWGVPTQRLQGELGEARKRIDTLEKQSDETQTQTRAAQAEVKSMQTRLEAMEKDLRVVREQRDRLERMVSQGRK